MDKDKKSIIDRFTDAISARVGSMPSRDKDAEAIAEKTNEQMLLTGDAAVAVEAIPAPVLSRRTKGRKRATSRKATKTKAKTRKAATKAKKTTPRKPTPKATKRKAVKKTRSSAGRERSRSAVKRKSKARR